MANTIRWAILVAIIGLAAVIGSIMIASADDRVLLAIDSPSDGKTVYSDTITVSGSATAMGGQVVESVTVNGMLASGTTFWSLEISLQAGSNTITVIATADTGNTATETITVTYSEPTPTSTPRSTPTPMPTPMPTPTPTPMPTPTPTTPLPTHTPTTPTPSASEIVEEELKKLSFGRILFNPPEKMKVGVKERVEVRITQNITENLTVGLKGQGKPQIEQIKVGTFVRVRLIGANFDIVPLNSEEQIVGPDEFTQWSWDVTPLKSGLQDLHLTVSVRILIQDLPEQKKDLPVMDKWISVEVNPTYTFKRFIENYGRWIVTTIISVIAIIPIILVWLFGRRRKKLSVGQCLFSIDAKFEAVLNNGSISEELKKVFKNNRETLSDNATVKKEEGEKKWVITDGKRFIIREEDGKLNIYNNCIPAIKLKEV